MKRFIYSFIISIASINAYSQTLTDGLLMPKKDLCVGFLYTHDQWKNYWEGELKRDNQNIGTITTQSLTFVANYGVTDKLNVIAMLPYVQTQSNSGTLAGMKGVQDLSVAAKYRIFARDFTASGFRAFAVGSFSTPLTNYTPDFLPLSLGLASTNLSGRLTANYHLNQGWYVNTSGAYTWRSNVKIDRTSYFSDGQLYFSDEVRMFDTFDFVINTGYYKNGLQADLYYSQQNTLGGGDIRRQDMPFVSNRMNFSKVGVLLMYYLPKPKNLAVRASVSYTVAGRNVGQSTTLMGGLLYTLHFSKTNNVSNR